MAELPLDPRLLGDDDGDDISLPSISQIILDSQPSQASSPSTGSQPYTPTPSTRAPRKKNAPKAKPKNPSWQEDDDLLFLSLLAEQVEDGNRPMGVFKSSAWATVKKLFNEQSGLRRNRWPTDFDVPALRNRYDNLKRVWDAGERISDQSGGLFDPVTGEYIGEDDWLADLCKKYRGASYFKTKPYTPELRDKMNLVYKVEDRTPSRGDYALGIGELEDITLESAPAIKKRKRNTHHEMAQSVEAVARALVDSEARESVWVTRATKLFADKWARKLSFHQSKEVLKRFRTEQHLAQQFCEAGTSKMEALVMELDETAVDEEESEAGDNRAGGAGGAGGGEISLLDDF